MCNVFDVYRVDVAAQELVRVESLGDEVLCTLGSVGSLAFSGLVGFPFTCVLVG
jgi:hypothetical protein